MDTIPQVHPTDDQLATLTLGPAAALPGVADHLASCPDCRGRAAALSAAAAVPPELLALTQYENVRPLGGGGMGVVYLAHNRLMDRDEVLKVVRPDADPARNDRFLREMRTAAGLAHANVVTAFAAYQVGGTLVFAMEFVPGDDLAAVVAAGGPLPVAAACDYAAQAADGLQHAHEKGTVHRDIKPANLMLVAGGRRRTVKILDFGLAKAASEREGWVARTNTGVMMGTPDYMPPEQSADAARADIRADVYSLGCTLYFLLTGWPPFAADNLFDLMLAHRDAPPPSAAAARPDVPAELDAVLAKMMAKDPADRYPTPGDAAEALAPFADAPATAFGTAPGTAAPARPAGPSARTAAHGDTVPVPLLELRSAPGRRPTGLRRWAVAVLAAGGVAVVAAAAAVVVRDLWPAEAVDRSPPNVPPAPAPGPTPPDGSTSHKVPPPDPPLPEKPLPEPAPPPRPMPSPAPPVIVVEGDKRPVEVPPYPDRRAVVLGPAGRWRVQKDELVYTPPKGAAAYESLLAFGDPGWTECTLTCEVFKPAAPGVTRLAYGVGGERHGYVGLGETAGGVGVYDRGDGKERPGRAPLAAVSVANGAWYTVRVELSGKSARVSVNGSAAVAASGPEQWGRFGFAPDGRPTRFRNLEVTDAKGRVLWAKGVPTLP